MEKFTQEINDLYLKQDKVCHVLSLMLEYEKNKFDLDY